MNCKIITNMYIIEKIFTTYVCAIYDKNISHFKIHISKLVKKKAVSRYVTYNKNYNRILIWICFVFRSDLIRRFIIYFILK